MVDDADRYHALKIVFESDGGQCLIDTLIKDVQQGVQLLDRYSDLDRDELVAIAARISTSRNMAKALALAAQNLEYADAALEEALRT